MSNKTAAEIEELDKRKSLIDIKAIAGLHSSMPPAASGRETPDGDDVTRVPARELRERTFFEIVFEELAHQILLLPRMRSILRMTRVEASSFMSGTARDSGTHARSFDSAGSMAIASGDQVRAT